MQRPSWRSLTDLAKRRDWPLRLADRLGRGHGRLRWIDHLHRPPPSPQTPDLSDWSNAGLAAAWVGHATVLLRLGGLTILTDPVLSSRVGLGLGLATVGPLRLQRPALSLDALPPVDVILLSHAHFDHLDRPTLARLPKASDVVTFRGVGDLVRDLRFRSVTELAWGDVCRVGPLTITALPTKHWGARTFLDTHRGYGAFLLEADGRRVLYGGDSAYHDDWRGMPSVDLAVLGIGAYDPYLAAHATPEQALAMADYVRAERVLPVHHSTFRLSHEPTNEPIERLLTAIGRNTARVVGTRVGDAWRA